MSVSNLENRNFFHQPDPQRDIQEGKSEIFLETVSQPVYSIPDSTLELVREKIIDLNFQSKNTILRLGNIEIREKNTLKRYHWKVVTSSLTACLERGEPLANTGLFLIFQIPCALFLRTVWQSYLSETSNDTQYKPNFLNTIEASLFVQFFPTIVFFMCVYSFILKAQKPYVDRFAVLQHLTKAPNSVSQFHTQRLTHQLDPTVGGLKPIYIGPITSDQISDSRFLCIGQHAIDVKNALSLIFQRINTNRSSDEVAHPIENRYLSESETIKFLNDVSAFFSISDSQKLLRCWRNAGVSSYELLSYVQQIENWNAFADFEKIQIQDHLKKQILLFNRIQEFLKLIPKKTKNEYLNHLTCHRVTFPRYVTLRPIVKEPSYQRMELTPYHSPFEDDLFLYD